MNAGPPVPHAAEIPGEGAHQEAARVEIPREGTQEDRGRIAAMAAMSEGRHPGVGPVTTADPQEELGFDRSTVLVESVVIHAVLNVAFLNVVFMNAAAKCRSALGAVRPGGGARLEAVRRDPSVRIVALMRSPGGRPVPIQQIPLPMISFGDVTPPRQPLKPVALFTASGAPVRCAALRGSCSS